MTTNNHPAHGPVSLDRLHQIREILNKAAAQSDGGNLGYAMADAVKVIDVAIAAFGAEPVAWQIHTPQTGVTYVETNHQSVENIRNGFGIKVEITPLYRHAQPAPVVPDALPENDSEDGNDIDYLEPSQVYELGRVTGWNACRATMLQAGNSPVTPDGWVMVPVEPTMAMLDEFDSIIDHGAEDSKDAWSRLIAAAPQQQNAPQNIPEIIPGWIPVSERVPERDVDVQVYCADKKEQMVAYMERNEAEGWFRFASLPNGGGVYCKPTHWMPLPAAPQQEMKR
ncbi:DUF551 domain-containing protein [Salmonella enterica]|nr:DUF551 domain-containing protein [Salmonella enterica]